MRYITFLSLQVLGAGAALAVPIELTIAPLESTADVELCLTLMTTACDVDTTHVAGTVTVAFDCPQAPGEIILHDFMFQLLDDLTLELNFWAMGAFSGEGTDVAVSYADPGNPMPPEMVTAGTFALPIVPADAAGTLHYSAAGTVCTWFGLAEYPCDDSMDLSTMILNPLYMVGTLTVVGDTVDLTLETEVSGPALPANPDMGTFSIAGVIHATGTIPSPCCGGDLTGDDLVDLADHGRFALCLEGPATPITGTCVCGDLDGDDDVDLRDFASFQIAYQIP